MRSIRASRVVVGDWRLAAYLEMRRIRNMETRLRRYRRALLDANRRVDELERQVSWAESEARTAQGVADAAKWDAAGWRASMHNHSAQLVTLRERLAALGVPDDLPAGPSGAQPSGVAVTVVVRGVLSSNWLAGMDVWLVGDHNWDSEPTAIIPSHCVIGVYPGRP